jgi:hypothetical protein
MKETSSVILLIWLASIRLAAQTVINGAAVDLSQATFVPYSIDSAFAISVPDYLVQVDNLSMDAKLQFSNTVMNTFMIVATETKSKKKNNDLTSLVKRFEENVKTKGGKILKRNDQMISGCQSKMLKLTWTVEGEAFMYVASFVETPKMLYKIYLWTPITQDGLEDDFRRIALSFAGTSVESEL